MDISIAQQISDFNKGKERNLLEIKYRAMAENPFRFFRGSCQLFYSTLARANPFPGSPPVWSCGDLHTENFGAYKGTNRLLYFDMNDFDEAMLMPLLWDLSRMALSIQLAAEEAGRPDKKKQNLVRLLLHAYRNTLLRAKPLVMERQAARGLIRKMIRRVEDRKETELVKKRTQKSNPDKLLLGEKLLPLLKNDKLELVAGFNAWLKRGIHHDLKAVDAGFRIAGTGSICVKRYVLLLSDAIDPQKKLLMDVKQALPPAALAYTIVEQPAWQNEAERITSIQEMMTQASPAFLSGFEFKNDWYIVKELQPAGDKVDLFQAIKPEHLENYLGDLGVLIAADQLRSSGRKQSASADELSDFASPEKWIDILVDWSAMRAEQVRAEFINFKHALKQGFFRQ